MKSGDCLVRRPNSTLLVLTSNYSTSETPATPHATHNRLPGTCLVLHVRSSTTSFFFFFSNPPADGENKARATYKRSPHFPRVVKWHVVCKFHSFALTIQRLSLSKSTHTYDGLMSIGKTKKREEEIERKQKKTKDEARRGSKEREGIRAINTIFLAHHRNGLKTASGS